MVLIAQPGDLRRDLLNTNVTLLQQHVSVTSYLPLVVGAYNCHDPDRPAASFSSRGPSRDYRLKPDLVAPGVDVLAARSAPAGASRSPGSLVRGSGTSYAAPYVTGAVALCLQAAGNRLSARQIRSLVLGSCDPVPDSDPYRFGRGYLNIPRLVADVQRTLEAPATAPGTKEPTMDTEDAIVLLAAAPATAYREYLYRPRGQLARWIGDRFEVVAIPGQRIGQALREGDVLLEVTLGRIGPGRCLTLAARDLELVATRPMLAHGRLVLRPRKRVEMTEPLPVEPAVSTSEMSSAPTEALPGVEYLANALQSRVDDVTKRAKRRPDATTRKESVLTEEDIAFLNFLYTTISQAGRAVAPEAAQLLRRYLDVDGVGVEVVNSGIYQTSGAVQAEIARHKEEIIAAVHRGKLPSGGKTHYDIFANAQRTESCEHAQNIPRPPRQRMVTADDERLKKANNRFWIQSYSTRSDNTISTTYLVTDCYEFEPFRKGLYTELQLLGQKLRLEDGLSEYLTRIGLAKVFTYESTWTETWQVGG